MDISEAFHALEFIVERDRFIAFLFGAFLATTFTLSFLKVLRSRAVHSDPQVLWLTKKVDGLTREKQASDESSVKSRAESETNRREVAEGRRQVQELRGRLAHSEKIQDELSKECERAKESEASWRKRLKAYKLRVQELESQAKIVNDQLGQIADSDGRTWGRPRSGRTSTFQPLSLRRTPIISVVNLKGGVGKTTLTANLGVALAQLDHRVLLVDLDHQGSLTSLCMNDRELEDARGACRFIHNALSDQPGSAGAFRHCVTRHLAALGSGKLSIIGADDRLGDVEMKLFERWLAGRTNADVRYLLRDILHEQGIAQDYDMILLDCPPRLTTSGVNALTASDYVLCPTLLDHRSAEAVPRLLTWLNGLRSSICPELCVLGVVGNRAYPRDKLIARERNVWVPLGQKCADSWGSPVRLFDAIIREHANSAFALAALDPRHARRYKELAHELLREIPSHARIRHSAVSPFTH